MVVAGRLEQRTWENEDGDRRSRVELVAEDMGRVLAVRNRRGDPHRTSVPKPGRFPGSSDSVDDAEVVGADV